MCELAFAYVSTIRLAFATVDARSLSNDLECHRERLGV